MRRWVVAALIAALSLPVLPAHAAGGGLVFVATWPEAGNGAVVPDPVGQRILSIANTSSGSRVTAFSGDRVRISSKTLDPYVVGVGPGDPVSYALDGPGRRLYMIVYPSAAERQVAVNARLVTLDVAGDVRVLADRPLAVLPPGTRYLGMSRSSDGRLQVVGQVSAAGLRAFGVVVGEIDPSAATLVAEPIPIRGCQNVISTNDQAAMIKVRNTLFLGCATTNAFGNSLPGSAAVAGIDLASPAQPSFFFLPGTYGQAEGYVDPAAGDEGRMLLVGSSAGKPGQAVWIFDIRHRVMIGQIAAGEIYGGGVDPATGRLYVSVKGAVQLSIDRGRTIPQAVTYENVKPLPAPIRVVGFNKTVIALVQGADRQPIWSVYRDMTPPDLFVPAEGTDYTVQDTRSSETPQYEGDAQAFGLRLHDMGGFTAAATNATGQPLAWWGPVGAASGLRDGDRDLIAADITAAHLGTDEASAKAITIRADQNTADDHATVTREGWPFKPALCADFAGAAKTSQGANPSWAPGPAPRAVCDQAAGKVTVDAAYAAIDLAGLVRVGAATSSTSLVRAEAGGLDVVARADARDVVIADTVRIGEIWSEARASAFGGDHLPARPGRASASYRRRFEHVSTPNFSCASVCPPNEVAEQISAALGSQVQVELPFAEAVATPRGAHAHAWREPWGHQQDAVLTNQAFTETQVPALRLSYVGDNVLPSRAIVEFAATKADSTWIFTGPARAASFAVLGRSVSSRGSGGIFRASSGDAIAGSAASSAAAVPSGPTGSLTRLIRTAGSGWRWVFAGTIGDFARSAAVWLMLGSPLFLAARRRYLARLS